MGQMGTAPDAEREVGRDGVTGSVSRAADLRATGSRLGDLLAVLAMLAAVAGAGVLVVVP